MTTLKAEKTKLTTALHGLSSTHDHHSEDLKRSADIARSIGRRSIFISELETTTTEIEEKQKECLKHTKEMEQLQPDIEHIAREIAEKAASMQGIKDQIDDIADRYGHLT